MSEAAPQLPAEQGPEQGYSVYHQLMQERAAAEEAEQHAEQARLQAEQEQTESERQQQIADDQVRAEGLGLPFMHPDKRSALEATMNAESVDDLPEDVDADTRRSATRGFHTSHLDAEKAFGEIKANAAKELSDFDESRTKAEEHLLTNARHRAGRDARHAVAAELEESFEDRFQNRLAEAERKHGNLGEGAKAMLSTNLREQMKKEDSENITRVGAKAGEARVNYVKLGGVESLADIRDQESVNARIQQEADALDTQRAWQDRMGVKRGGYEAPAAVRIPEQAVELVRPEDVKPKDWLNMNAAAKQQAMEKAQAEADAREAAQEAANSQGLENVRELRTKLAAEQDGTEESSSTPSVRSEAELDAEAETPEMVAEMVKKIEEMSDAEFDDLEDRMRNMSNEEYMGLDPEVRHAYTSRKWGFLGEPNPVATPDSEAPATTGGYGVSGGTFGPDAEAGAAATPEAPASSPEEPDPRFVELYRRFTDGEEGTYEKFKELNADDQAAYQAYATARFAEEQRRDAARRGVINTTMFRGHRSGPEAGSDDGEGRPDTSRRVGETALLPASTAPSSRARARAAA